MILQEIAVELGSDHQGFLIHGVTPALRQPPAMPENTIAKWWPDSEPDLDGFLVMTGSQWGPYAVLVRVLDADPGTADDRWEDVVELSVVVGGQVTISEIVDGPFGEVDGVSGLRRMRISAHGRAESAARDSSLDENDSSADEALERYLVELWPAAEGPAAVVRERSQYAKDVLDPPEPDLPPEAAAGTAAAWAIVRDVQGDPGARPLPGELGRLEVVLDLPGTATKVFNRVQHAFGWPPCQGGGGSPDDYAIEYHDATYPASTLYEEAGHIATTLVEVDKPRLVIKRWNWALPSNGSISTRALLLASDSQVTITIEKSSANGEEPRALVRLVHEGVPVVWTADLERLWRWDLVRLSTR